MKTCTMCGVEKPEEAFWFSKQGTRRYSSCISCNRESVDWPAESYRKVHKFTPAEDYMIRKLSEKPTLAAGLDNLYRKNPRRWHQVVVAAKLVRKEAGAA